MWIIFPKCIFIATGSNAIKKENRKTIIIDAGHGGRDPGKVGITKALEKDINLIIALQLKELLESQNVQGWPLEITKSNPLPSQIGNHRRKLTCLKSHS